MVVRNLALGLLAIVAVADAAWAQQPGEPVNPGTDRSVACVGASRESDTVRERRALKSAPMGARRTSAHAFTVKTKSGVRRFADKKPYRDQISGFHWAYCGYVAALDAHLIGMDDEDLFSGKLLLDRTGRLLDAGHTVYPSPDGKLFLAASQHDGNELERWTLSDLGGGKLWSGDSGDVENGLVLMEYENPHWTGAETLSVTAICEDKASTKGVAALVHENGTWRWRTDLRCPG